MRSLFESRERDRSICQFHGHDSSAVRTVLFDPPVLTSADPVGARSSAGTERVALLERGPVVLSVGNRDACADRVAGTQERPEVRSESDPERRDDEVVPAALSPIAPTV